jgi:eukaryotic-like serine/threonine-protein kinase
MLTSADPDLRDICRGRPELVDAMTGRTTGVHLVSFIGSGGMSTVFAAELDATRKNPDLSPTTPTRLAVKLMQPSTWQQFKRLNQDPAQVFLREVVALSRIMERQPPTEFVVGFYGSGYVDVSMVTGDVYRLPWLAIEHVDGGGAGVSLGERVERAEGIDPIRALRILRGLFSGVTALHEEGVVHRDLKPENVLMAGPIDDETPKVADCGIARVDGLNATVAGMTPSYGAPEQILSTQGLRNPLVGPWTDVHALAAVAWFVLGGEDWCRHDTDSAWHAGQRRSLRTAQRTHPGFLSNTELLAKIDAVLAQGASARLPESAWEPAAASDYLWSSQKLLPAMWSGPERYTSVATFGHDLFPLLEQAAAQWTTRATKENRAATAFRPTQPFRVTEPGTDEARAAVQCFPPVREPLAGPGDAVFQPDGRFLMRFEDRLEYFIDDKPHRVSVPAEHVGDVAGAKWMARGPGGGFALVGPSHMLLVRGGRFTRLTPPKRTAGGEVGEIIGVVDDGRAFGIVTDETDDSDGSPELWRTSDGVQWDEPVGLPLGGEIRALSYGPYGFLVVGARKNRGRAMLLGFDNHPLLFAKGVTDRPPLFVCACSAMRESWGAGEGFVLFLERSDVHEEAVETTETPIAMALDLVGIPWLVTRHCVLRRHTGSRVARWRLYHRREADEPPFVAIGFTPSGARVLDAGGGGVHLAPRDVRTWRPTM